MLEKLATLHTQKVELHGVRSIARASEEHQHLQAQEVLEIGERVARLSETQAFKRALPALRRIVMHYRALRDGLFDFRPLPPAFIHGDVHPGNVFMRRTPAQHEPVFIDWANACFGSPLEDVSLWLDETCAHLSTVPKNW